MEDRKEGAEAKGRVGTRLVAEELQEVKLSSMKLINGKGSGTD